MAPFSDGAYTGLSGLIAKGHNGGAWDGMTIRTTAPDAAPSSMLTTMAAAQAGDVGKTTVDIVSLSPSDAVLMYTYAGDANLSGHIDGDDFFRIDAGYLAAESGYSNGDFNYDGRIDADDYFILDRNYSRQGSAFAPEAGVTVVPEPAHLAWLAFAAATFARRRRLH